MSTTIKPITEPIWVIATNNFDVYIPAVVNVGTEFTTGQPSVEEYATRELLLERLDELEIEYGEDDYVADEAPQPAPDWDGFNFALITDPTYHQAVANIRGSALPWLDTPVVVALGQVADKGIGSFKVAFPPFCQYGQVSIEQRETWAQLAESFNLPADFIAVLRSTFY